MNNSPWKGACPDRCDEYGKTRDVAGEMPEEYTNCFLDIVREDGFVPRPGVELAFLCGQCLLKFEGHETVDDLERLKKGERRKAKG